MPGFAVPQGPLSLLPEIAEALHTGKPVVALESTVIAHGLPHDQALEAARTLEAEVRTAGAVPATVAVLDGRIRIGLEAPDLERLIAEPPPAKLSRRDLAATLASGEAGATTVAATMACAALAGIGVFATGGIGGVHRGGEQSLDISADLTELARSPVAVVCAGAKAILDLPRTLEVLETLGVPVLGLGTDRFPAFWCRDSGLPVSRRCADLAAVAAIIRTHRRLDPAGGVLVCNPVPAEAALDAGEIEAVLGPALNEAAEAGIAGPALTPFLLARLGDLSSGRTLAANLALLRSNARIAGELAVRLAEPALSKLPRRRLWR
jgi:pseudouridine-5'-phosphate glycosidase